MIEHGFAAEPHKSWLVSPATKEGGTVTCHDLSGFLGSWQMREGGVFFKSDTNDTLDMIAEGKASNYCRKMNKGE